MYVMSKEEMMKMLLESEKLGLQDARILENLLDRDSIIYIVSILFTFRGWLMLNKMYNIIMFNIITKGEILWRKKLEDQQETLEELTEQELGLLLATWKN